MQAGAGRFCNPHNPAPIDGRLYIGPTASNRKLWEPKRIKGLGGNIPPGYVRPAKRAPYNRFIATRTAIALYILRYLAANVLLVCIIRSMLMPLGMQLLVFQRCASGGLTAVLMDKGNKKGLNKGTFESHLSHSAQWKRKTPSPATSALQSGTL